MVGNTSKMMVRAFYLYQGLAKNTYSNPSFMISFLKKVGEKFGEDKKRMYICIRIEKLIHLSIRKFTSRTQKCVPTEFQE